MSAWELRSASGWGSALASAWRRTSWRRARPAQEHPGQDGVGAGDEVGPHGDRATGADADRHVDPGAVVERAAQGRDAGRTGAVIDGDRLTTCGGAPVDGVEVQRAGVGGVEGEPQPDAGRIGPDRRAPLGLGPFSSAARSVVLAVQVKRVPCSSASVACGRATWSLLPFQPSRA